MDATNNHSHYERPFDPANELVDGLVQQVEDRLASSDRRRDWSFEASEATPKSLSRHIVQ
jgi:hypothetical protein